MIECEGHIAGRDGVPFDIQPTEVTLITDENVNGSDILPIYTVEFKGVIV